MSLSGSGWWQAGWAVLLLVSGFLVLLDPGRAPLAVAVALVGMVPTWVRCWRASRGTALRGALVWAALAIALGLLAQVVSWLELLESGRPWSGRLVYLMVLAVLAGLVSVLGARSPGGGAWAILMVLLVVVLLIPWLEAGGRVRRAQWLASFHLDSPWSLFYGLLVVAGVTNYLPTRYGAAACALGAGLVLEYLGLTRTDWAATTRAAIWPAVAWTLALSCGLAEWRAGRSSPARNNLERLWLWYRDHWGVVWALRIQERFNRTAELGRWPIRLTWFGLAPAPSSSSGPDGSGDLQLPPTAEATLRGLIRRFVAPGRIDALLAAEDTEACHPERTAG